MYLHCYGHFKVNAIAGVEKYVYCCTHTLTRILLKL